MQSQASRTPTSACQRESHGDNPLTWLSGSASMDLPPSLERHICVDALYGCWLWDGRRDRDGYGRAPGSRLAHIAVYEELRGPIANELTLDHLCRRRNCCRPEHLEPVKRSEQERRKRWRYRVKMTACPRGHDLKRYGRLTPEGGRVCRLCCGL